MTQTTALPVHDEGRSADIPFVGFQFPLAGSSYSHFVVESNGEVYLTDGSGVVDPATFGISSLAELRGAAQSSPRIAALSGDFEAAPWHNNWDILVDDTVPGQVKVTWQAIRYLGSSKTYGMSVTIVSDGSVRFDYDRGDYDHVLMFQYAGISAGNAVGTGLENSSDLSGGADSGSLPLLFENGWLPFDLDDHSVLLVPNGAGGFTSTVVCGLSRHASFGEGCYAVGRESIYQHFTDAAVASAALSGGTLILQPTADGYVAVWSPGFSGSQYVAPTAAATQLPVGNDGEVIHALALPFPVVGANIDRITVQGNGIIAFGPGPVEPTIQNYLPQPERMLAGSHGGIYCWHAYNEDEGGDVWVEHLAGVTYVTFRDVENFPLGLVNPSTFQVQFEHATGRMLIVFVHIDSNNSLVLGSYPQDHVIGFTPPLPSADPGGVDLLTQLPWVTTPDVRALRLSVSPDPISTTSSGTLLTYAIEHAVPVQSGAGQVLGVLVLTTVATPPVDLGVIGAPGCFGYVGSLPLTYSFTGAVGLQQVPVALPAGLPPGASMYAQAAVATSSNALGLLTSNAVASTISTN